MKQEMFMRNVQRGRTMNKEERERLHYDIEHEEEAGMMIVSIIALSFLAIFIFVVGVTIRDMFFN